MNKLFPWVKRLPIHLILVFVLTAISLFYNYHEYIFERPQSIHAWRQADCASIALNYHQKGMHFWQPEVHNHTSDQGTTGYCATSEAPLMYYFVATLYNVFGYHEFILRLCNTLIFLLGLFYLYRAVFFLSRNVFWSIVTSIVFFCSPVLVYYGNGFISNTSALSFAIMGWYFFIVYLKNKNWRFLIIALLLFFFAGLFKVTALMSLFAILGYFLIERLFLSKKAPRLIKHGWIFVIGTVLSVGINIGWLIYANFYNKCHDCTYFSTTIFPIWNMPLSSIISTLKHFKDYWLNDFFHPSVFVLLSLQLLVIIIRIKSCNRFMLIIFGLLLFQSLVFIFLQFWTFYDHDYYLINQFILPIFLQFIFYEYLSRTQKKVLNSIVIKVLFVVFIAFNVVHVKKQVTDRYTSAKNNYYKKHNAIYTISPYLRTLGITSADKVIYIPDGSNVSLYLMNQPGWTQYTDARFNNGKPIRYNFDSLSIKQSIDRGADYLIVRSVADLIMSPYLKSYTRSLKGEYKGVLIFDLTDTIQNFNIEERSIYKTIYCDAETVENNLFKTTDSNISLNNGLSQMERKAFEGLYSMCLTQKNPFGMTFSTTEVKYGQSFKVSILRNGNANAGIVASGESGTNFYVNNWKVKELDIISDWVKLEMEFFIPLELDNTELKIYAYNPTHDSVYYDNFKIEWFNVPIITRK